MCIAGVLGGFFIIGDFLNVKFYENYIVKFTF